MRKKNLLENDFTSRARKESLREFELLLNKKTLEKDWQLFFEQNPYVLSQTLPVNLVGLYQQMPLSSGRPDFVFRSQLDKYSRGDYGVIELKRPDSNILGIYSSKIIAPSRNLSIAKQETELHLKAIENGTFVNPEDYFIIGNRRYAFIIIGRDSEIVKKCKNDIYFQQFKNILPMGFYIYTYDEIFKLYAKKISPLIQILSVDPKEDDSKYILYDFGSGITKEKSDHSYCQMTIESKFLPVDIDPLRLHFSTELSNLYLYFKNLSLDYNLKYSKVLIELNVNISGRSSAWTEDSLIVSDIFPFNFRKGNTMNLNYDLYSQRCNILREDISMTLSTNEIIKWENLSIRSKL